jgi:3-oxoacyl-[acyl-carrier protein] reductase
MANVIVTGGSRGIRFAIVQALARDAYTTIAIAGRKRRSWRRRGSRLPNRSISCPSISITKARIHELVRDLRERFGPNYGLVNNAGLGTEGILATMPEASIEKLVQLNVVAPLVLTKYVVRSMMNEGTGHIVNISSIVASTGYSGVSAYAATKAAMIGLTKSLAREVGRLGITVNAVAPGFLETELTADMTDEQRERVARRSALQRLADTTDVAEAVAFLVSEKGRNITGTVLTVDAGSTA